MSKKSSWYDAIVAVILTATAIYAIKSLLLDDSTDLISKDGEKFLDENDDNFWEKLEEKSETKNSIGDSENILVDID